MSSEDSKCCGPCRGGCCGRFFQRGRELESIDTNHSYTEEERRDLAKFHSIDYMPCTCAGAFQPSMLPLPTYPVSRHSAFIPNAFGPLAHSPHPSTAHPSTRSPLHPLTPPLAHPSTRSPLHSLTPPFRPLTPAPAHPSARSPLRSLTSPPSSPVPSRTPPRPPTSFHRATPWSPLARSAPQTTARSTASG